jgi:hypothetical protein
MYLLNREKVLPLLLVTERVVPNVGLALMRIIRVS